MELVNTFGPRYFSILNMSSSFIIRYAYTYLTISNDTISDIGIIVLFKTIYVKKDKNPSNAGLYPGGK